MTLVSSISNFFISKNRFWNKASSYYFENWSNFLLKNNDNLYQILFLEMKKSEIEETKVIYSVSVL